LAATTQCLQKKLKIRKIHKKNTLEIITIEVIGQLSRPVGESVLAVAVLGPGRRLDRVLWNFFKDLVLAGAVELAQVLPAL